MPSTITWIRLILLLSAAAIFLLAGCARPPQDSIPSPTLASPSAQTPVRARATVPAGPGSGGTTLTVTPLLNSTEAVTPKPAKPVPRGHITAVPLENPQPAKVPQAPDVRPSGSLSQSAAATAEVLPDSVEVRAFVVRSPRFGHSATLMYDGRVLVSGGFTGVADNGFISPIPTNTFQIYDPTTDSWLLLAKDVIPSLSSGAIRLSEGKYLSMGVVADGNELKGSAGILDLQNTTWTTLPRPPTARALPALTMLPDGRVLVLSGLVRSDSDASGPEPTRDTFTFDPVTGASERTAPMDSATGSPTVVSLDDGRIMVLQNGLSRAEIYNPASDVWTTASPANVTFLDVAAVKLPGGTVLVTGGANEAEGASGTAPTPEIYDPSADTWTATEPMIETRRRHTLTLLPDGRVVAIGGVGATTTEPLATSEIYDPLTNKWLPGPEISAGRFEHTATLLEDGRILIFGGISLDEDEMEIEPTHSHELLEIPQTGQ